MPRTLHQPALIPDHIYRGIQRAARRRASVLRGGILEAGDFENEAALHFLMGRKSIEFPMIDLQRRMAIVGPYKGPRRGPVPAKLSLELWADEGATQPLAIPPELWLAAHESPILARLTVSALHLDHLLPRSDWEPFTCRICGKPGLGNIGQQQKQHAGECLRIARLQHTARFRRARRYQYGILKPGDKA